MPDLRHEAQESFAYFRLPFIQQGRFAPTARTHCPLVTGLLRDQVGEITSAIYRYSRNGPVKHRHLADHLIYYLVLREGEGASITIDGGLYVWETGEDLLVDAGYARRESTPVEGGEPALLLEIEFRRPPRHQVAKWLQYLSTHATVNW
jgi:hypothetical protein